MMFCPNCGTQLIAGGGFCPKCGARLAADSADRPVSGSVADGPQIKNIQMEKPKKKKFKKLPIILIAIGLAFVAIIAANSNDIIESGKQAKKDEEYIKSQQSSDVNLSQTYTNEDEGITFKYPSAWVSVSEENFSEYLTDTDADDPLVLLANETEDLPEADSYIMVSKFPSGQDDIDHLFIDDEQFASTFDEDVTIKNTSITELDGLSARKITYFDPDNGYGYESYLYAVGSSIYQIDFVWVGESSGNSQRFFDAIIDSYKITSVDKDAKDETDSNDAAAIESDSSDTDNLELIVNASADTILYQDSPIVDWIPIYNKYILEEFGDPVSGTETDGSYFEDEPYDGYEDIWFVYDNYSFQCKKIVVSTEAVAIEGITLDKNYDSLVKIFGEPMAEGEFSSNEGATVYKVDFSVPDQSGYRFYLSFELPDLQENATRLVISEDMEYLDSLDNSEEDESANYIDENFEWVEKPEHSTVGSDGLTHISGIVRNKSNETYSSVTIYFDLYDAVGNAIGDTLDAISNLKPQATWKFDAVYYEEDASYFEFRGIRCL